MISQNNPGLQPGKNLSDLTNTGTARTNLGLGSIATQNSSALGDIGATSLGVGTVKYANYPVTILSAVSNSLSVNSSLAPGAGSGAGIAGHTTNLTTAADLRLGFFVLGYTDLTTDRNSAAMAAFSAEAWTAGSIQGTYLDFQTTPIGSATRGTILRVLDSAGIKVLPNAATAAGGTQAVTLGSSGATMYWGSGVPSLTGQLQGSVYFRTDGSSTTTRMYVATSTASSSAAWASLTASS